MHSPPSTRTPSGFGVYRLSVGSFLLHPRRYLWWLYVTKGPAHLHLPAPPYSDLRSGQSPALCWWVSLACSCSSRPYPYIQEVTKLFLSRSFLTWHLQTPSSVREGGTPSHLWLSSPLPNVLGGLAHPASAMHRSTMAFLTGSSLSCCVSASSFLQPQSHPLPCSGLFSRPHTQFQLTHGGL